MDPVGQADLNQMLRALRRARAASGDRAAGVLTARPVMARQRSRPGRLLWARHEELVGGRGSLEAVVTARRKGR